VKSVFQSTTNSLRKQRLRSRAIIGHEPIGSASDQFYGAIARRSAHGILHFGEPAEKIHATKTLQSSKTRRDYKHQLSGVEQKNPRRPNRGFILVRLFFQELIENGDN